MTEEHEREIAFLKRRLNEVGGKVFHLNEEITRLNAENNQVRTATSVMSEVYEALDVADSLEVATKKYLTIVVKQLNVDAVVLFNVESDAVRPLTAIGCSVPTGNLSSPGKLPSFWVKPPEGDTLDTLRGLVDGEFEEVAFSLNRRAHVALWVGRIHRGGKIRLPLSASDELVFQSALGVYGDLYAKYTYLEKLGQLNEDLDLQARSFERFVPKDFLHKLGRERVREIVLGDSKECEMGVLFTDIRSFTTLSESMSSREVFSLINGYLGAVVPMIRNNGGFVDKYIGDAIMALFDDPRNAIRAGCDMLNALDEYNASTGTNLAIGIGIHWGGVVMGTLGDVSSMQCTVISDTVNLASRIEGLTKYFSCRLLVSQDVMSAAGFSESPASRSIGAIIAKGKRKPVELHHVVEPEKDPFKTHLVDHIEPFQAGVTAFKAGHLEDARRHLTAYKTLVPEDQVASRYLEAIDKVNTGGQSDSWDGHLEVDSK